MSEIAFYKLSDLTSEILSWAGHSLAPEKLLNPFFCLTILILRYLRFRLDTYPQKTDPEIVLGLVHKGGRKDGKAHTIYTGADYYRIA